MSAALRWGLLGTAHINRRLIPAMRAARRSAVAAVASRDARRAPSAMRASGTSRSLMRATKRCCATGPIDAVYIPLPNSLHVEWTLRALDAGKHVLCEKPLALTADDVDRVEAVARDRQRVVAEAFMYRHEPLTARVLELLADGAIGQRSSDRRRGFTFARTARTRRAARPGARRRQSVGHRLLCGERRATDRRRRAGGALRACASHGRSGVDDSFTGLLQFPGGVVATIHSSFRAAYRTWLDVAGTEGTLRVTNPFKPGPRDTIEVQRGDERPTHRRRGIAAAVRAQIDDFVAAALDGRPPAVSLRTAAACAALAALHRRRDRATVQL